MIYGWDAQHTYNPIGLPSLPTYLNQRPRRFELGDPTICLLIGPSLDLCNAPGFGVSSTFCWLLIRVKMSGRAFDRGIRAGRWGYGLESSVISELEVLKPLQNDMETSTEGEFDRETTVYCTCSKQLFHQLDPLI